MVTDCNDPDYDEKTHCYACGCRGIPNGEVKTTKQGRRYKVVWVCPNGCIEKLDFYFEEKHKEEK